MYELKEARVSVGAIVPTGFEYQSGLQTLLINIGPSMCRTKNRQVCSLICRRKVKICVSFLTVVV